MDILSLDEFSKLSFNIYLPKRSTQCRMELSKRIQDLGGKTTFKIAKGVILIIDSERELTSYDIHSNIKEFDIVYLYEKGTLKIYKSKEGINIADNTVNNDLRIIFYEEIVKVLERIENISLIYQYYHGLPRIANISNVISLVMRKSEFGGVKFMNKYVIFEKSDNQIYDFPKYTKDVPDGFSIFMTLKEKEFVESLVQRKSFSEHRQKSIENKEELNSFKPKKEHNLCYICRMKYENYKEHVKSPLHRINMDKTRPSYEYLKEVFQSFKILRNEKKEQPIMKVVSTISSLNIDKRYEENNIFVLKKQENLIGNRQFEIKDYYPEKDITNVEKISINKELLNNPFLSNCNINNLNLYIENENKSKNFNINLNVNIFSRENENTRSKKSSLVKTTQTDLQILTDGKMLNKEDKKKKSIMSLNNLYDVSFDQIEKENTDVSKKEEESKVKEEEKDKEKEQKVVNKDYRVKRFFSKISPDYLSKKQRIKYRKNNFDKIVENLKKFKELCHS